MPELVERPERKSEELLSSGSSSSQTLEVSKLRVERARAFGDVWLGWTLRRALELDRFGEQPRVGEAPT
jgi:hypothetical protein